MNKLLIYPYNQEDAYFLDYIDMLTGYSLKSLVVLESQNMDDLSNESNKADITITSEFEEELVKCDTVLFLNTYVHSIKEIYKDKISKAVAENKEILLGESTYEALKEELKEYQNIKILDRSVGKDEYEKMHAIKLENPDMPIITVLSPGECCEKYEVQLELRKVFESRGYRVLQFGTKEYATLFGMQPIPSFLKATDMSLPMKIDMLNFYVNQLVFHKDYDVIIFGIPGGMLPYDKRYHNYYGEISLVVSHAFDIDINVMCTYHNAQMKDKDLKEVGSYVNDRLGCITDYFFMSNTQFRLLEDGSLDYLRLGKDYCRSNYPTINGEQINFCHLFQEKEKETFFNSIVSELEDNIEII